MLFQKRKNHINLVEAYKLSGVEIPLVLIGREGPTYGEVLEKIEQLGIKNKVKILGYLDDSELVSLLNGSLALLFPSLFEGTGMPPLEAMACGVPTLISNIDSLSEYAGDASLKVDPHSIKDIAKGIELLYSDKSKREFLIEKGLKQVEKLSWESHVKGLLNVWNNNV